LKNHYFIGKLRLLDTLPNLCHPNV
jgi:hypothetical protein